MSENMSSDWGEFYHRQTPSARTIFRAGGDGVSDATAVTTTITTATNSFDSGNSSTSVGVHLSPEGRVSKPVRRRSRASRRTPTTLLNTDTANFRAMVQQFTGGPSAPFGSAGSHLSFAMNPNRQTHNNINNPPAVMVPAGFQIQYQQQQLQSQQPYNMFSLGNNNSLAQAQGDGLFNRLGNNPRLSDGLVMDGVSSPMQVVAPPPPSSNENRSNTFLF